MQPGSPLLFGELRQLGGAVSREPEHAGALGSIPGEFLVYGGGVYQLGVQAAAVVLTAGYILWTLQRVLLGRNEQYRGLPDLTIREMIIAAPLVILTVALGVAPQRMLLSWMSPSVDQMVRSVTSARSRSTMRLSACLMRRRN